MCFGMLALLHVFTGIHSSLPCDSLCSDVSSSDITGCLSFLVLELKMSVTLKEQSFLSEFLVFL